VSFSGMTSGAVWDRALKRFDVVSEIMADGMLAAIVDCK
jgi:hypothetical protein